MAAGLPVVRGGSGTLQWRAYERFNSVRFRLISRMPSIWSRREIRVIEPMGVKERDESTDTFQRPALRPSTVVCQEQCPGRERSQKPVFVSLPGLPFTLIRVAGVSLTEVFEGRMLPVAGSGILNLSNGLGGNGSDIIGGRSNRYFPRKTLRGPGQQWRRRRPTKSEGTESSAR